MKIGVQGLLLLVGTTVIQALTEYELTIRDKVLAPDGVERRVITGEDDDDDGGGGGGDGRSTSTV